MNKLGQVTLGPEIVAIYNRRRSCVCRAYLCSALDVNKFQKMDKMRWFIISSEIVGTGVSVQIKIYLTLT